MHIDSETPKPTRIEDAARLERVTLATLSGLPRWVAWQTEERRTEHALPDVPPALTKVPYAPRGAGRAASNAPSTWGTRLQAEQRLQTLPRAHGPSGVGIMLGVREDAPSLALGGIDLDTCRNPDTGELAPWALTIIDRFATYTEVSPSGTGVKLFFQYRTDDRAALQSGGITHGRTWKQGEGEHPPAIELHLSNRYFAVTDQKLDSHPDALGVVTLDHLMWIVREAGPAFQARRTIAGRDDAPPSPIADDRQSPLARVNEAAKTNLRLRHLLSSGFATVHDQSRSGIAFALGCALKEAGFSFSDMCAALRAHPRTSEWAATKGAEIGGRELGRIWKNCDQPGEECASEQPGEPRPLFRDPEKPQPYPVDALGPVLAPVARAIEDGTQAPPAICAQAALGVAALAVQPFADVLLPTKQARPLSLYLMTIAASGERKSSADEWAMQGVRVRERSLADGYEEAKQKHRNEHDAWTKARKDVLDKTKNAAARVQALAELGPEPKPPVKPLIVVSEPTWEGLVKMMPEAEPSLGLFSSEGGAFLGGHGMSDDAKARTAAGLSEAWDGTPIRRVRGGDGASVFHGRRLSAHLMVQPNVAELLVSDPLISGAGGQGLTNRFLMVQPESTAGKRLFRDMTPEAERTLHAFRDRVAMLLAAEKPLADGQRDVLTPRALPLSAEARRMWIAFHDANESELGEGGRFRAVAGFANKAPEHAARLAAVLTLIEDQDAPEVPAEAMANGIRLVEHYRAEALRLVQEADVPEHLKAAERLRVWLIENWKKEVVSLPEIYQRGPYALRTAAAARAAAGVLVQHGWLVPADPLPGTKAKEVWHVVRLGSKQT